MKNEELLNEALSELCTDEFSAFNDMPEYDFPESFDNKMNSLFYGNGSGLQKKARRIAIIAIAAALVLAVCGFAVLNIMFHTDMSNEEYIVFSAESLRDAPKTIEHYYEPTLPERYVIDESAVLLCTNNTYGVVYVNQDNNNDKISFTQNTVSAFRHTYHQDQHKGSPQWIIIDNPGNDSFDLVHDHPPGYNFIIDYVTHFWTDGEYIYSISGDKAVIDSLDLNELHEVFPEAHDAEYYFLEVNEIE